MTHRILFVCLGNICRSPTAEAVVRAKADAQGVFVTLDSAGTGNWHNGEPPFGPMQDAARARGYDMSDLRARQVTPDDFDRFDLIVAMDAQNLDDLNTLAPAAGGARIRLMTDFADTKDATEVPDPYFTRDFDGALDLIERCADGLLRQL
ncbi:low molecular weight protein-tyrosine-phosphatase YfkJ [Antarctobacter heliothermus]|uniref:protein-tyrosine-phosphatase n=1 Tax=Antarctobacter heliothermus TaxID=74033 RepID=A0A222EAD1_9RHOB|nr:low molecular weight protein-tyrosine-phosphatase [Antarctobacter heliothermus]ASP23136.1 low molecular weight protein-tyrosine-phosphatase YfkJ [Antarctobacter heliothermus]